MRALALSSYYINHYGEDVPFRLAQEYAWSFTEDPAALMTMARRVSRLAPSCPIGLSYMAVASSAIAHESYHEPSSINFPLDSGAIDNLGKAYWESKRDLSTKIEPHILSRKENMLTNGDEFDRIALPIAQRTFGGSERFEQNWQSAITLLETLHERNLGSKESLEYLVAIYNKLSTNAEGPYYVHPEVCARAVLTLLPRFDAQDVFGLSLLRLAAQPSVSADLRKGLLLEARQQFAKSPTGTFNSLALDLSLAAPIMSHAIFSVTPALYKLDPIATNVVAKMTGDIGCNESWSLMSAVVRKYLWYHANHGAIKSSRYKGNQSIWQTLFMSPLDVLSALFKAGAGEPSMSFEMLSQMAIAGVEEAEWALAGRLEDDHPAKNNLMSFSAHKGRAAAQIQLAKMGTEPSKSRYLQQGRTRVTPFPPAEGRESEASVLDAWENPRIPKRLRFTEEQLRLANLELITRTPGRWEGADRGSTFIASYTESQVLQSWYSFFGIGRDRSLRDSLMILQTIPSQLLKYIYLYLFQGVLLLNGVLLEVTFALLHHLLFQGKMVAVYALYILLMSFW